MKKVLIWGRYGNYGPDYPRNRVIESVLRDLGCELSRFLPKVSALADIEYSLRGGPRPDLIWVPCFRQRDLAAAARYARRHRIALVFDPLISAYDKQVNEKHKFATDSAKLTADGRRRLQGFFSQAGAFGYAIYGHTDSRASDEYNIKLSQRRAKAVADVARSVGAMVEREIGFGERQPIASNSTAAGMQKNRRVEVVCYRW